MKGLGEQIFRALMTALVYILSLLATDGNVGLSIIIAALLVTGFKLEDIRQEIEANTESTRLTLALDIYKEIKNKPRRKK